MATSIAETYNEALQRIAREYWAETGKETGTVSEIAAWAMGTDRWEAQPDFLLKKCREDFAAALRDEKIKDDNGLPVRLNQVTRVTEGGVQKYLWGDIRKIDREHMRGSVAVHREQMVGECKQVDRACTFWNTRHPDQEPVECEFDFREDVLEGRQSGKLNPPKKEV